ncbi:MAG TPA: TonB-dependent receptor [Vitreimonas sp.]|uniref:TonB-dependent receptor domain-containing protein n=1 Tax=Vitreimonas sp. TaxID=3069702 RepID=UPI002D4874E1|nr:TonB-dependent receptor [Vitreimonas sp.]HYD86919.1 TonB-dependent receptor [Vitreimonas sp.]
MFQFNVRRRRGFNSSAAAAALLCLSSGAAHAQRVDENAVRSAEDAFGASVGNERIGLYSDVDARGFSPVAAGNIRLEGLYIDNPIGFSGRLVSGSTLRVGITAQGYPFPAPTGLSDYALRSVGDESVVSVNGSVGPFGGHALSVDMQQPFRDGDLSFAGGVAYRRDEPTPGAADEIYAAGGVLHWQASERLVIQPFFAVFDLPSLRSTPLVFTDGASAPPESPARNLSPDWVWSRSFRPLYGTIANFELSDSWTLRAGLFRVENETERQRTALLRNTQADGSLDMFVAASQEQSFGSTSGELRATWSGDEGPRRHALHLSVRGRAADRTYGGGVSVPLGPSNLYEDVPDLPEPVIAFGPQSQDEVRQTTLGVAYQGVWTGVGEVRLGVQRANYEKTVIAPSAPVIVSTDEPWLYDAALAVPITSRLSAYAGYTVGLEESPVAPENAVNRNEAPPALRTSQRDAGIRYRVTPDMTLVAGVFEVAKPYFNLDPAQVYRELGEVSHRGVELSLAGRPMEGLTLIAGAVLLDGEVSGELVDLGLIGPRPVGQTERQLRLNLDYALPWNRDLSVDLAVLSTGDRAASSAPQPSLGDAQFTQPGRTTLDLGARWRFGIGDARAVARLLVQNVTDNREWDVGSNGAFTMSSPRRVSLSVTADF